jgi:sugar lactone lactonase YvrE
MDTPLRARFSAISVNSILKYCGIFTSFLTFLVVLSSFTKPVIENTIPAANTLDKLGLTSSTPSAGAYSLRSLSSSYSAPLVRIAIGSSFYDVYPDATTDQGFSLTSPVSAAYSSYNASATGATGTNLSAVIGSNSATVAIWYDQSGNDYNGIQSNSSLQPQIINAGTINTSNSKPALKFTGSQYLIVTTTAFNADLSGSVVYAATSANTSVGGGNTWYNMNGIVGSEQGGDVADFAYGVYNGRFTAGFGGSDYSVGTTVTVNDGVARISSWTRASSSGSVLLFNNGNTSVTTNLAVGNRSSVPSVAIGAATTGGLTYFNGTISEIALFPVVYNITERQAIEASQSTYYGISFVQPQITTSGTLTTLTTAHGTASASTSFNVSGSNLSAGILVTPPAGYEVSTNNSIFSSTVTVGTGGTIASTPVYVRLAAATNYGTYAGDITLSSTGANSVTVATVPGTVTPVAADFPTISYGTAKILAANTAVTPIAPTVTQVNSFGYGGFTSFGNEVIQAKRIVKDTQGNLYVLDQGQFKIYKYPANGGATVEVSPGAGNYPYSLTIDAADNLYYSDINDRSVKKIAAGTGTVTVVASGFNTAYNIAAASDGTIYVVEVYDNAIKKIPAGGGTPVTVGTGFNAPLDVAVDSYGDVYVADQGNGKLKKIFMSTDGHTEDLGDVGQPFSVTVDKANNVFVGDAQNFRIYEYLASGIGRQLILSGLDYQVTDGLYVENGVVYVASSNHRGVYVTKPTGGYFMGTVLPAGLSFDQATGIISGTPPAISAAKDYTVTAYNGAGGTSATVNIFVGGSNSNLNALSINGTGISPAFVASTLNYTASVTSTVTSVDITPTLADATATITYNGNPVTSGSAVTVSLAGAVTTVPFIITTTGGATKTYTITVTKAIAPTVTYTTQTFAINTAITPLPPTAANVAAFGYGGAVTFGGPFVQIGNIKKDKLGNTYMLDVGAFKLYKYAPNSTTGVEMETGGAFPSAITIDDAGNLYLADAAYALVKKIEAGTGTVSTIADGISYVFNMAITKDGTIYMADGGLNKITKLLPGSNTPVAIGIAFNNATDMAVDIDGNLFVADQGNMAIKKIWYSTDSHVETVYSGSQVISLAFDKANNLFAGDPQYSRLLEIPADGSGVQTVASGADYQYPGNLIVDDKGLIYVSTYTANAKLVTPTGGYFIDSTLPKGLTFNQNTGAIGGTPTVLSPVTSYHVTAYNGAETVTSTANIGVATNNPNLSALVINSATISPSFNTGTIDYTASASSSTASVDITPTLADTTSAITYNGSPVTSGAAKTILLNNGANIIAFVVTAPAGATKTYTITVTKAIVPTVTYTPQTFAINTAITPLPPAAANVAAFGYGGAVTFGGPFVQIGNIKKDKLGNTYMLDVGAFKLYKYAPNSTTGVEMETGGAFPSAITIDDAGNLYLADAAYTLVKKIEAGTGTVSTIADGISYVFNMAITKDGTIYMADGGLNKITKLLPGSNTPVAIGIAFNNATDMAVDIDGNLFVADQGNMAIKKIWYSTDSHVETVYSGSQVISLAFDKANNLFAGDPQYSRLLEIPADGSGVQTIASGSDYQYPGNLIVDDKGLIYVSTYTANAKVVTPTGGYFIDSTLPKGLTFNQNTGAIGGTPTVLSPVTSYLVTAYNGLDKVTSTVSIAVETDLDLTNLLTDAGTLTPMFDADSTNYKVTAANGTTAANITATLSEASNFLTINGTAATSGVAASIALNADDNIIPVVVTSPVDNSTKTYTVKIHRVSDDYKLSNLTVSSGSNNPSFNADVFGYTVDLPYGTTSAKLTPTANAFATIKVADVPVLNGAESQPLSLNSGDNNIEVKVTAEDGTSVGLYTVNFRVSGPSSVSLSNLVLSAGTLNPAFSAGNTNYQVSVPVGTSTIAVHPVVEDALSVATVNGSALDGTTSSVNVPLNDGLNVIAVSILANDGTTTGSYTITVNKLIPAPTNTPLTAQVYNTGAAITPLGAGFANVAAPGYFALADTLTKAIPTPTGIATNKAGDLFVADITAGAVYKIPAAAGGAPVAILTGLNTPLGVATDADGNVYAAALGNTNVKKITPGGAITSVGSGLSFPTGLTVDAAGNIYVNETANHAVKKVTPAGVTTTITTALSFPYGITVDDNYIYVADNSAGTIERFSKSGGAKTTLISGLTNPTDVKLDAIGNIYVNQGGTNTLTKYDKTGNNPITISTGYEGLFGIAVGADGKLYTTDNGKQSVEKLSPSGGYYLSDVLPDGLIFNEATGVISGTPIMASAAKDYTITAYNSGGGTASVVNISVLANTNLTNLAVSKGTLDPEFDSATTSYAVSVPYIVSSLVFTPTVADANATVTVNGVTTASGTVSATVLLGEDVTNIPVIVTGRDNVTTKQYTVAVTRQPALVQVSFILDPQSVLVKTTGASNYNYTTGVSPAISSIRIKPTTRDADAVMTINGQVVGSGAFSNPITLNAGPTIVEVVVKKTDVIVSTYTITVNHDASNNALTGLALDPPSLFVRTTGSADVNYTTAVAPGVTSVRLKPNAQQEDAVIRINGDLVTTGTFSNPITLNAGPTVINVSVTAQDGVTVNTYAVTVNHDGSNNSKVSLALNPSSVLITTTGTSTYNYSTSVTSDVTSISVKPTAQQENAVIRINGDLVASGSYSNPITLNIGATVINVTATAQDGVTVSTYSITVNRTGSNNAKVSLALNPASVLATTTGTSTYNYVTAVSPGVTSISVKPTAQHAGAVIRVNGDLVASGTYSNPIALSMGATVINVSVTAQDGVTVNTFAVTVNRTGSNNAKVGLALNPASVLTTTTGTSMYNYVTSVSATVTSVSVRPTAQQADAIIKVNGDIVASGALSAPILLNAGPTVINVSGTAQDGVTVNTYSITVNRTGSNNAKVSLALNPASELVTTTGTSTYNYVTSVSPGVSSISIKPTAQQADAVIRVNDDIVSSGTYSGPITLNAGSTLIIVSVTAQDGVTVNTFSVTVNRTGSSNVLARIALNPVTTLTATTGPGDINYQANVGEGQSTIRVIPTLYDNATATVNGVAVTGGTASDPITLTPGSSTLITIVVTAENGSTTKTYTVNVNRPSSILLVNRNDSKLLLAGKAANNVAPTGDDGVVVHQGVSPNGDGANDFLYIEGISAYPGNKLSIMNTGGTLVFEAKDYGKNGNNMFDGHSNKTGTLLKPGTYFYALEYQVNKAAKRKTGYIIIKY